MFQNEITLLLDERPLPEDWVFVWDEIPGEDEIDLTPDQLETISLCSSDCRTFIETVCWIERKETGQILPFVPYDYQWDILERIQAGENLVINKSRRVGVSWIVAAYVAWLINFHEGVNVLLLSKKEDDAKKLLRKVKFILNNLYFHDNKNMRQATSASFLRGEIGVDNQQILSIVYRDDEGNDSTHSEVASLTMTTDSGRSEGATFIFWDECAFAKPDDEKTWGAILPTTLRGGQYVLASTPNGVGGVFWSLVRDGQANVNEGYFYKEVHWTEADITHEQVLAIKKAMKMTDSMFLQEFELQFTQLGMAVFNPTHLAQCYRPLDENPELTRILIEYDESGKQYFSGIDSATGIFTKNRAPDYNAFISLTNDGIVAHVYQDRASLGDWAGKALAMPDGTERFVPGITSRLQDQFPGVAYIERNNSGFAVMNNHRVKPGSRFEMKQTNPQTKVRIINNLVLAVEGHRVIITDTRLYMQMYDYMRISGPGTFGPPSGGHDDLVMALAWAYDCMTDHGGKDPPKLPPPSPPDRESVAGIKRIPDALRGLANIRDMEQGRRMADDVSPLLDLPAPEFKIPEPEDHWFN